MFARPAFPSSTTYLSVPLELFWTPPPAHQLPSSSSDTSSSCGDYDQTAMNMDTATIDALLLFQDASSSSSGGRGSMTAAERKAKHCEVQRRFAKRKQIEFKQIKKQAATLELQYNFLHSAQEIQKLTDERASLLLKYKMCGIDVDGNAPTEKSTQSQHQLQSQNPGRTHGAAAPPLFDFDLTRQKFDGEPLSSARNN